MESRILSELVKEKKKMMRLNKRILEEKNKAKKGKKVKSSKKEKSGKQKRKLTAIDSDHHQDEQSVKSKKADIFGVAFETLIDISVYKPRIRVSGLSPLDAGRNTLISSTMYNQIKTMINIEKSQSSSSKNLVSEPPRSLFSSGISLMKATVFLVTIFL